MPDSADSPNLKKRNILVSGSTGRQGRAFIDAVASNNDDSFHILALTRNSKGPKALDIASTYPDRVTVVEGDLDKLNSIRTIFEAQKEAGQIIWGVFCVLAFPGLGVNPAGEEKQGRMLADLSFELGVSHFVFSSVDRGGEDADETMMDDRLAKIKIEKHVKELGTKGLKWTIIRPGFFMENYEGFLGAITFGVLQTGLKPTTAIELIAVRDIGAIAYGVFKDAPSFESRILVAAGEFCTVSEQEKAHKRATGKSMPSIPSFLARILISLNSETKKLIADMERVHTFRDHHPPDGEFWMHFEAAKRAYSNTMSFEKWCLSTHLRRKQPSSRERGWNGVSLRKLLTGKQ